MPSSTQRRRVLVVSPHLPPVSAVDHQRVRLALPYWQSLGWDCHILTVDPEQICHPRDPLLLQSLPADLAITRVGAWSERWTRRLGLGNMGWRCWQQMAAAGDRLLTQESFDLVFFSTTLFPLFTLGPRWQKRFGVPYVLDFQDPWRVDRIQQKQRSHTRPGGRLKYALDKTLARWLEPPTVRQAAQIVSVSPVYIEQLQRRYPELASKRFTLLPFGAPEADFAALPQLSIKQPIFDPTDGYYHWVYVGRGGDDLVPAVSYLMRTIHQHREVNPEPWQRIRIHFVGTSYAPAAFAKPSLIESVKTWGLEDMVTEYPQRIPYFEALQVLTQSHGILILGSRDPAYSASKVYPCLLAQKPLLALLQAHNPLRDLLRDCGAHWVDVTAVEHSSPPWTSGTQSLDPDWIQTLLNPEAAARSLVSPLLQPAFQNHRASTMSKRLVAAFEQAIAPEA